MNWTSYFSSRRRSGFSLLGAVVAVVVLALLVLPFVGLVGGGARRATGMRDRFLASRLAMRILDYYADFPGLCTNFTGSGNMVFDTLVLDDKTHFLPFTMLAPQEKKLLVSGAMRVYLKYHSDLMLPGATVPRPGLGILEVKIAWTREGTTRTFTARQIVKNDV